MRKDQHPDQAKHVAQRRLVIESAAVDRGSRPGAEHVPNKGRVFVEPPADLAVEVQGGDRRALVDVPGGVDQPLCHRHGAAQGRVCGLFARSGWGDD